jgi:hypothetical protein
MVPTYLGNLGLAYRAEVQAEADRQRQGVLPGAVLKRLNAALAVDDPAEAVLAGGIPYSKTLLCVRDNVPIVYDADRFGFNNPDQVYVRPITVAVFGDSLIEGFCLRPGEDIVSRIRETYPRSLSIAVRGNGPLLELAALGRYGAKLKPRYSIMAFFEGNDWRNFGVELADPWLREALIPGVDFGPHRAWPATLRKAREIIRARAGREVTKSTPGMSASRFIGAVPSPQPTLAEACVLLGSNHKIPDFRYELMFW